MERFVEALLMHANRTDTKLHIPIYFLQDREAAAAFVTYSYMQTKNGVGTNHSPTWVVS
jgi:hypothetical protein